MVIRVPKIVRVIEKVIVVGGYVDVIGLSQMELNTPSLQWGQRLQMIIF